MFFLPIHVLEKKKLSLSLLERLVFFENANVLLKYVAFPIIVVDKTVSDGSIFIYKDWL